MKRILSFLLVLALTFSMIPGVAVQAATSSGYTYTVKNREATIISYYGTGGDILVPPDLGGYPVTTIGDKAFKECTSLTSVRIPDCVVTIGQEAFSGCTQLTSVTIMDGVATIGWYAFSGCAKLTAVTIPDSVTAIGKSAFSLCDNLSSVTIGKGVTTIGEGAFYKCRALTGIWVDGNNPAYCSDEKGVLYNKNKTTLVQGHGGISGQYTIPDGVITIGKEAFFWRDGLTSVTIPSSVTTIGNSAFQGCSLTSVMIPGSVVTIGDSAFQGTKLTNVTIPDSVTTIGKSAFYNCLGLVGIWVSDNNPNYSSDASGVLFDKKKNVLMQAPREISGSYTIPDSVTTVGDSAFFWCDGLTSVTIPDSVITIGEEAFFSCLGLTSVTIPDSVTTIGDSAFNWCNGLTSVTIGNAVTTIGNKVFYDCAKLTSVTIGNSVTYIGMYAFFLCNKLTSVTIPDRVTHIEDGAFQGCERLTDVYYGGTQEQWDAVIIGAYNDFLTNASLHVIEAPAAPDAADYTYTSEFGESTITGYTGAGGDITIPAYLGGCPVTTIGERAFEECNNLTAVVFHDRVKNIGTLAFTNCHSLTSISIGAGIEVIDTSAFAYCTRLRTLSLPASITVIAQGAFEGCDGSLEDVYVAGSEGQWGGVTIGENNPALQKAVLHFSVVEEPENTDYTYTVENDEATITGYTGNGGAITIPSTLGGYPVVTIGDCAFEDCSSLTAAVIPDSVTTIGYNAFKWCSELASVTLGKNVTTVGSYAFYDCTKLTSVTFPDSVTTIGACAFGHCTGLVTITIPKNVKTIDIATFAFCTGLLNVTIPDSVTSINSTAFQDCTGLTSVTIGKGVASIGEYAFYHCTSLSDVHYGDTQRQWETITIGANNECLTNATFHFVEPEEAYVAEGTCGENLTWTLDEEGTLTITGEGAMDDFESYHTPWSEYNEQVQSIVMDPRMTTIGNNAFYFLPNVSEVVIPEGVTRIGVSAFASCYGLRSVTVPASVTEIGRKAFADNLCLGGIWVDEDNADYSSDDKGVLLNKDKTLLIQVPGEMSGTYTIPATVTAIENFAFEYSYVDAVVFPNGLKTIGRNAFNGCYSLAKVVLPNSVTEIGYKSFSNMEFLSEVTLSSGLTTIPEAAFYGNACLASVVIPEGVQTIGPAAFAGCAELKEVTIPVSVTSIDQYGFGSPNLKDVYYGGTEEQWNAIEFAENNDELLRATIHCTGHTHSYTKKVTKPTCTAKGYTTYTCECGDSYKADTTNALGHSYSAATCTKAKTCTRCKITSGKALGHAYKSGSCVRCKYKPAGAKITTQPVNVAVASGKTAKVAVKATGDGLKYVWYYAKKGSTKFTKTTVTTASYSVKMSSSVDGRKVYCVVTDKYGNSVKSSTVTLYKGTPAKIKIQPKSVTIVSGKTGKLTIKATGSSLKYQWYVKYKGASSYTKVGKSSNAYSFKMASKLNGAQAYCVVKDKYGIEVKSSVVTIKQAPKPKITTQPKSVLQVSGKTVKFTIKASGEGLKYQWYYAKKGSNSFKKLSGKTSATYSVKVSSSVNGRKYYCLVTDKYGQTVKSSAATLSLKTVAKITTQPKSVTVANGKTAKVTIKAVGDGLKYTWYYLKPGTTKYAKSSITKNVFSVKMAAAWKNAKVYCVIADKYGNTVKSSVVTLKMK